MGRQKKEHELSLSGVIGLEQQFGESNSPIDPVLGEVILNGPKMSLFGLVKLLEL